VPLEVEERPQSQTLEDDRVAWLDGTVAGDEPRRDVRVERRGDQRRGAGDEPVEDEWQAARRRADDQPDDRGDLEPTDGREGRERVARPRPVDGLLRRPPRPGIIFLPGNAPAQCSRRRS